MRLAGLQWGLAIQMPQYETWLLYRPGWIAWHSSRQMNDLSFQKSPDKSQISYFLIFLLCNYIGLFIPVARLESDRLLKHAQSLQLAGDKSHTILPGVQVLASIGNFKLYQQPGMMPTYRSFCLHGEYSRNSA